MSVKILNPTGCRIRVDTWGDGSFGASRDGGSRRHQGEDRCGFAGQWVVSPVPGRVIREAKPYGDGDAGDVGLVIKGLGGVEVKMFYVKPLPDIIGRPVSRGQIVGRLVSLRTRYQSPDKGRIRDHVHTEVRLNGEIVKADVVDYVEP